jgi:type IV pilus biogenesis protein CpaD/CtpE
MGDAPFFCARNVLAWRLDCGRWSQGSANGVPANAMGKEFTRRLFGGGTQGCIDVLCEMAGGEESSPAEGVGL